MKTLGLFIAATLFIVTNVFAQVDAQRFMTTSDLATNNFSNIAIKNTRNTPVTVYSLYVRQFSYVNPGQSCATATPIYPASSNTTVGSFTMPITIGPGHSAEVGSNYLYNMIYQAIYYVNIIIPSSPPGCALPGCTWGSDTSIYNWCIYVGALSPIANSPAYSSNVSPSTDAASGVGYNYNLINNFVYLGPISCNDQSLTCTVATKQTQSLS